MNNRVNTNDHITELFLAAGIDQAEIAELISQVDYLENKVLRGRVDIEDVKYLVRKLVELMTAGDINREQIKNAIYELVRNYTSLFPFLIKRYNANEDQQDIKQILIEPLMLEIATQTDDSYISRYLGQISLVTMDDEIKNRALSALAWLDQDIEEVMQMVMNMTRLAPSLSPYVFSFFYLNQRSPVITTSLSEKTFFDYLESVASDYQDRNTDRNNSLPSLVLVSDDLMHIIDSKHFSNSPKQASLLKTTYGKEVIFVPISKDSFSKDLLDKDYPLQKIIYGIQHWYNSHYFNDDTHSYSKQEINLSHPALAEFKKLTVDIKWQHEIHHSIFSHICLILNEMNRDDGSQMTLGEFSARMTSLLFYATDEYIRETIDVLLEYLSRLSEKFLQSEIMQIGKVISSAFSLIELTIKHLAVAFYHYNIDQLVETTEKHISNEAFKRDFVTIKEIKNETIKDDSWRSYFILSHRLLSTILIKNAASIDLTYSLHEQARLGNNELLKNLLDITQENINELDIDKFTPMTHAILKRNNETVYLLFKYGAKLNWVGETAYKGKNNNLLHLAAGNANWEIIPWLLKKGVSASRLNSKRKSPLALLTYSYFCHQDSEEKYKIFTLALTYMLSYSNEPFRHIYKTKNYTDKLNLVLLNAVKLFRFNLSILYVMHESGALQRGTPKFSMDILTNIALHLAEGMHDTALSLSDDKNLIEFEEDFPKFCCRDIYLTLLDDKNLLSKFLISGMKNVYAAIQLGMKKRNQIESFFEDLRAKIPIELIQAKDEMINIPTDQQVKEVKRFFTPKNKISLFRNRNNQDRSLFPSAKSGSQKQTQMENEASDNVARSSFKRN